MSTTCPPKRSRDAGRPALPLRRRAILPLLLTAALLAGLVGSFLPPPAALAATFTVNHLGDAGDAVPGDGTCATAGGVCTLRAAIEEANAWAGADTITFSVNGTILLTETPPWISSDITITGPGANLLVVDGSDAYPVFRIIGGTVTISGLTIQRGHSGSNGAGISHLVGTLTLRDCVVRHNNIAGCVGCGGAGIYSQGNSLTVLSSQVYSNTIQAAGSTNGGGIMVASSSSALISGTAVMSNTALCTVPGEGAFGGGLNNWGATRIVNSTVRNNSAQNSSGSWGGGIYNSSFGNLAMTNTQVLDNDARAGGGVMNHGALRMSGGTIHGNTVDIDGGGLKNEWSSGVVTLNGVTLDGNYSGTRGGAVYNESSGQVTLNDCTVSSNTGINNGGGLYNGQNGAPLPRLVLTDTLILTNTTPQGGGGIYNCGVLSISGGQINGNQANGAWGYGGGLYNCPGSALGTVTGTTFQYNSSTGYGGGIFNWATLTVMNSLVTANTAPIGGGICSLGSTVNLVDTPILTNTASSQGGGLYSGGALDLTGGTVRGNTAPTGAGIYNAGTLQSNGTIVADNTATGAGGGLYSGAGSTLVLQNTVVSHNHGANGAGVYVDRLSTATITSSQFDGNQAGGSGGGLYNNGSTVSLAGQTFVMNNSAATGGGLYNGDYAWSEFGTMYVTGCAIDGNTGQGIWSDGTLSVTAGLLMNNDVGAYIVNGSAAVVNSFIANNTAAGIRFGTMGPIDAVLSGAPANANTFGSNGPAGLRNVDVQTWNGNPRINAFWNDWGVVALQDVEDTIWHQMDNAGLARVDYYTLTIAAAPPVQAADGVSPVHITTTLGGWFSPAAGDVVAFDTSLGNLGSPTGTTDGSGSAYNTLTSLVAGRAYITASASFDTDDRRAAYTDVLFVLPPADLSITKSDGQSTAVPGQPVTYTIVAGNAGPGSAPGSTVTDSFPAVLTGVTWTCTGAGGGACPPSGAGNINAVVDLPVGGSVTFVATGTVDPAATGTLVNTAAVTVPAGLTDPNPANNSATDTDTLTPQADLAITKSDGQPTAVPGQPVTYTIVASNAGPSSAPNSNVFDDFPAVLTGVTWTCTGAGGGACPPSGAGDLDAAVNLPVGGSVTFVATGTVDPAATGTLVNTAAVTVSTGAADPNPANNSATDTDTLTPQADLAIAKGLTPAVALPGQPITYTVTFSNDGPSVATGVVLTDIVPLTLTGVSVSSSGVPITDTGHVPPYVWSAADMAPGAVGHITITAVVDPALSGDTAFTNTATIYSPLDLNPANNSAGVLLNVTVPRVRFSSGTYSVLEDAGAAPITVTLDAPNPYAEVTVVYSTTNGTAQAGSDYTGVRGTLTIPAGSPGGSFAVPILDDSIVEGDETVLLSLSAPAGAALGDPGAATLTIVDDDVAGVVVMPISGLVTTEWGGTATFTVYLTSRPAAPVTIGLVSDDPTEGTVSPAQLVFDAGSWATPQVATVTGVDDAVVDGNVFYTIVTSLHTNDPVYAPIDPDDVSVLNLDDETAGVVIVPTSGLITTEAGGSDTFTVYLTSQPTAVVTIGLVSSDLTEGTVAPAQLVFDAGSWATPQAATVTGVDDAVVDGSVPYTIVTTLSSADPRYAPIDPADVGVVNLDDDVAGVVVTPTSGLVTTEGGGTATFSVYLTSQPTAAVTIDLASSDLTEGTVSPAQLVFDAGSWATPQVATVTGVDDVVVDGNVPYTIVTSLSSSDPVYSPIDPADVGVVNIDDDHQVANYFIYLPLLYKEYFLGPDLVVESLVATGNNVTVVVRNIGNGPAVNEFWVDVYLDPNTAPTHVNQLWHDLTPQGLAWGLVSPAVPLWPGQAVTLNVNDAYLWPSRSHVAWPIPAGTAVYAQVDSWHPTTTYGAVRELHEAAGGAYNNILGPVYSTAGAAGERVPAWGDDPPAAGLPARP